MKYAMRIFFAILLVIAAYSFIEIHKGSIRIDKLEDLCNEHEKFDSKQEFVEAAFIGELDIYPIQGNTISVGASNFIKSCTCRVNVTEFDRVSSRHYECI